MSHLLDQLRFFNRKQGEFADGHGETRIESGVRVCGTLEPQAMM